MERLKFEENNGDIAQELGISHERAEEIKELCCHQVSKQGSSIKEAMDILQTICKNDNELAFANYRIGKCANCPGSMLMQMFESGLVDNIIKDVVDKNKPLEFNYNTDSILPKILEDKKEGKTTLDTNTFIITGRDSVIDRVKQLINKFNGLAPEFTEFLNALKNNHDPVHFFTIGNHIERNEIIILLGIIMDGKFMIMQSNDVDAAEAAYLYHLPITFKHKRVERWIKTMIGEINKYRFEQKNAGDAEIHLGEKANVRFYELFKDEAAKLIKQLDGSALVTEVEKKKIVCIVSDNGLVVCEGDTHTAIEETARFNKDITSDGRTKVMSALAKIYKMKN